MRRRGQLRLLTAVAALTSALGSLLLGPGALAAHATSLPAGASASNAAPLPWPPGPVGEPRYCMALYNLTEEKEGSFRATVEVMNHTTDPMVGWSVTWKPSDGARITRVHGGWLTHHRDGTVTVRSSWSTFYIPPNDQEVTFDIWAHSKYGYNFPNGSMKCTSP